MIPVDPLWVYITVPGVLISVLVLIKIKYKGTDERQRELSKRGADASGLKQKDEASPFKREVTEENLTRIDETRTEPEPPEETKPKNCVKFLGYLYLKKAPVETHIPSECYNCPRLLQCLYSPHVIQKVYGE